MNAMATLFGSPLAQAIGWALLHLLWQGVLVAAILAASLALMRRQTASARYLVSLGALAILLALGTATAYRAYDPAAPAAPIVTNFIDTFAATPAQTEAATRAATTATPAPTWEERLAGAAAMTRSHLPQIVFVWMAGVLLLSVRLLGGWVRAHRIATRNATDASPEWQRAAERLSRALRLRQTVRLIESAAVEVPAVIGWLRPVVLLPVATLAGLSREQMEMILAHELAHIRRHDFFVNLMQAVVETLLFYHPAVWWISNRVRVERENCCDDMAVAVCGNPLVYARALTRLEELRVDPATAIAAGVAANGGSLIERIRRLAGVRGESPNGPARWAAGASLFVVVAALLIAPALPLHADRQDVDQPKTAVKPKDAKSKEAKSKIEVKAKSQDSEEDDSDDIETDDDDAMPTPMPDPMAIASSMAHVAPMIRATVAPAVHEAIAPAVAAAVAASMDEIDLDDMQNTPTPDSPRAPRAMRAPRMHSRSGKKIGEGGTLSIDDLITLRSVGVTPAYIDEMRGAGLGELSLDDIVAMRVQGVTSEYVKNLRAAGLELKDADTVVSLRVQGVTGDYLAGMRAAGYTGLTTRQLVSLRAMGVTPDYVKQMADAGYRGLSADELSSLRAQGVTPSFVKALADAGYTNLSARDLVRLAAVGVNAEFIRDLAKYRTK
jgi:beta-lactamase regulating signal transducer with metallopeptidase domain